MPFSRYLRPFFAVLALSVTTAGSAVAHVSLVYPTGGEMLVAGSPVTIEWVLVIPHDQIDWDLYYSPDGGVTWEAIELNLPPAQMSYQWIVPASGTGMGRVRVVQDNVGGDYEASSTDFVIEAVGTAVEDHIDLPGASLLLHAYPNPFTGSTVFSVELLEAGPVQVEIFDVTGNRVALLEDDSASRGIREIPWSAGGLPAGIYLARVVQRGRVTTTAVVLAR